MKILLENSLPAYLTLSDLKTINESLPGRVEYWTDRWMDKLKPFAIKFEAHKNAKFQKFGQKSKEIVKGKEIEVLRVPPEKMEEFQKELDEIGKIEEDVLEPMKLSMFDNVNVPVGFFKNMGDIIVE